MKGLLGKLGFVALLLVSSVMGQTEQSKVIFDIPQSYNYTGGGARAMGMGGAFLGISDDISAITWNPAGVFAIEKPTLGLTYNGFRPRGQFTYAGQAFKQDANFSNLALFSFASPIRIKGHPFVASLSYTQNWDEYSSLGVDTTFIIDPDFARDEFTDTPEYFKIRGDYYTHVNTVNIGFGTQIKQNLLFGLSANVYTGFGRGSYELNRSIADTVNPVDGAQHVAVVYDSLKIDSAKYSGVNFTIGFKYLKPKFTVGLIVRTPFALRETVDQLDATTYTIQGVPIDDHTQTSYYGDRLAKINIPLTIGAGVGYKVKENLLLGLDAEIRSFGGGKFKVRDSIILIPGAKDEEYYTEDTTGFRNVITIRGGGEYLWKTNNRLFPIVPLRAGLAYVPIPAPSYNADSTSKTTNGMSFSLGCGVRWAQIHLDLAYQYQKVTEDNGIIGAKLDRKSHRIQASFSGVF